MKKTGIILICILCALVAAKAQAPQVINIEKLNTWSGDTLVIVGNNFSTNPSNLKVYFGPVQGQVVSSSNTVIEVVVPAQAHFEPVRVLNLSNGLFGYSSRKFFPSFNGSTFDETRFSAPLSFDAFQGQGEFYDICSCDLNQDGKTDIVASKFAGATDLTILRNTSTPGSLSFTRLDQAQVVSLNVQTQTLNITCSDVNGDGKPDIVASRFTGGGGARNEVYVLRNTSTASTISFANKVSLTMPNNVQSRGVTVVDIDGDGKPEIVVADSASDEIYIFKNNSLTFNISFNATPATINLPGAIGYNKIDYQDMNDDGLQDLIISPFIDNNLYVLYNTSSTNNFSFSVSEVPSGSKTFIRVKTGDLNNDGLPDLVATSNIDNEVTVYKNLGNATFDNPVVLQADPGTWGLDMADMNGDGYLDIVAGNNGNPTMNVFINTNGSSSLSFEKTDIMLDLSSRNIIAGDFDGDAKPDIAFTATGGGQNPPFKLEIIRNINCFEPEITNMQPASICPGQTFQLTSIPNPNATFTWYKNGAQVKSGTENFLDIVYEVDAIYRVEANSEGGTCILSDEITVGDGTGTIPGDPQPQVLNSPVCEGEDIELTVQELANATYIWRGPNDFTSSDREPVIPGATTDMAGVYTVNIKIGDCLSSENDVIVEVATLPAFTVGVQGNTTICEGTTSTLSVTSRTGYSYVWQKDGAPLSATGNTFAASEPGVYSVMITNNTTLCQVTTNEVEIAVVTPPTVAFDLSANTICTGEPITTTNNSTVDSDASVVYLWDFGDGTTSAEAAPTINFTEEGNYTVSLDISYTGVSGCTASDQATVTVSEAIVPIITASSDAICPEEELELSVTGTFAQAEWSTGETGNSIIIATPDTYTITTVDNNGCTSGDEYIVSAKEVPELQVTASTASIPVTEDTIRVNSNDLVFLNASGADTYLWSPADLLNDATLPNPEVVITGPTPFHVTGTITGGCSAMDSIFVAINTGEGLPISPNKVFAPESSLNPTWEIDLTFLNESCELAIFDERGKKILEENGNLFMWDGTSEGNPVPEGVYYYVVGCPTQGKKAGTVLVVRQ